MMDPYAEDVDDDDIISDVYDESDSDDTSLYIMGVDESAIAKSIDRVQVPALREVLDRTKRLEALLGDAQPMVANLCSDIESGIRTFLLELNANPGAIIMAAIAGMEPDKAMRQVEKLTASLHTMQTVLNDLGGLK